MLKKIVSGKNKKKLRFLEIQDIIPEEAEKSKGYCEKDSLSQPGIF
jgi:hypothetical protein